MIEALARFVTRFRWFVLGATAVFVLFAGVWGTGVMAKLTGGGFDSPGSESARTVEQIDKRIGRADADVLVIYSSTDGRTIDEGAVSSAIQNKIAELRSIPEVRGVRSYYDTRAASFVSHDRQSTYLAVQVDGENFDRVEHYRDVIKDRLEIDQAGISTQIGGPIGVFEDINTRVIKSILVAEMISTPILLVLLFLIFGSLVAASTPLLLGMVSILGAFVAVRLITTVTDVSNFAINIITILGLGLAIDYALFMVSRFREELDAGRSVPDAVARTMATAGRTVLVSGLTVALGMSGLLLFNQGFLRSMAYGGISAVVVAVVASLTVLPALLAVLGPRINAGQLPWRRRTQRTGPSTGGTGGAAPAMGGWERLARSVMRRPVGYAIGAIAVLVVLAAPFAHVKFGGVDARVLPTDAPSRVANERLASDFTGVSTDTIKVLVEPIDGARAAQFAQQLKSIPHVTDAAVAVVRGDAAVILVGHEGDQASAQARAVVRDLRDFAAPPGARVMVGGPSAELVDLLASLGSRLPWMALMVGGTTFVLLFLAFGSLLLPLKAIAMNAVSIGASFGVVVWIFQDGHLSNLLGFTSTGNIEASQPILMLAMIFGLSMDYEVFLLSRIREQWDHTGDNTEAVATGLQRTGKLITAAALLMMVVIGAFSVGEVTFIKMIGIGMAVAIAVDATIVRAILVPATMRLLGNLNWWSPRPLRVVYERFGIRESDEPAPVTPDRTKSPTEREPVGADV